MLLLSLAQNCRCFGARRAAGHSPVAGDVARPLSAGEFGRRFEVSYRSLWLIAAGITRCAATAEEVVQDAAVIALGKLGEFSLGTNFGGWMGKIVQFVAYNTLR